MKQLLNFIFKNIVSHGEEVEIVQETVGEDTDVFRVRVNPEDMGQAIGKRGRIIKSVRQIARSAPVREAGRRVIIQLAEPEESLPGGAEKSA